MKRMEDIPLVRNSKGRLVPKKIGNVKFKPYRTYLGIHPRTKREIGRPTRHRDIGSEKVLYDIDEAIKKAELSDGMSISFHHHLRNGDRVVNMVLDAIHRAGLKDIRIFPTALFPVHEPIIEHIKTGTVSTIEGSLNGPIGKYVTLGNMSNPVILRSHSGRSRALAEGEIRIDVAFLAVSSSDPMGNANGVDGPSAFGPCSFPRGDAHLARRTVLVTDNLVDFPCHPISIPATDVDYILKVDSIGDPSGILSGSLEISLDPSRSRIVDQVMSVLEIEGLLKDGLSFQAGSGGISLALTKAIADKFKKDKLTASYAVGGTTKYLVDMLESGNLKVLLDGQSFDPASVESLKKNRNHVEIFVDQYSNLHSGGTVTEREQTAFLSATEVDLDFNVNVNTHSDGWLLHGIGGHQDVAYGSQLTFVTIPLTRSGNPIIKEKVLTITTPGELIDIIATESGIAFNTDTARKTAKQRNEDLESKCKEAGLPVLTISELRKKALQPGSKDLEPDFGDEMVAVIKYIDGTVLDNVRSLKT